MSNFRRNQGYIQTEIGKFSKIFWKNKVCANGVISEFYCQLRFSSRLHKQPHSTDKMYQLRIPNIFEVLMTLFQHCKEEQTSVGYIF